MDFSDFSPTLLELLNLPEPEYKISGKSFAGALTGDSYNPRRWVYAQIGPDKCMVRTRDWKLLWDNRLYNMSTDPYEKTPIPQEKDTPESGRARTMLDSIKTTIGKHINFPD